MKDENERREMRDRPRFTAPVYYALVESALKSCRYRIQLSMSQSIHPSLGASGFRCQQLPTTAVHGSTSLRRHDSSGGVTHILLGDSVKSATHEPLPSFPPLSQRPTRQQNVLPETSPADRKYPRTYKTTNLYHVSVSSLQQEQARYHQ